ncbi:hypothetical protein [Roseibium suaedae]|uniref:Uncharacterized protein n=1 Tax=Roseibium suaedae TaxID=735517 RepID=A0A1M7C856_9HYPH|nr:hypothetical protein [Roseibium suaedae]SHL63478.1 hypothetical protein SAMN05444272_1095 [Roseibium suaedae]
MNLIGRNMASRFLIKKVILDFTNNVSILFVFVIYLLLSNLNALAGESFLFCSEAGDSYGNKFKSNLNLNSDAELVFENFEAEIKFPLVYLAVGQEEKQKNDCFSALPEELQLTITETRRGLSEDMSIYNTFKGKLTPYFSDIIAHRYLDGFKYAYVFVVKSEDYSPDRLYGIKSFIDTMD